MGVSVFEYDNYRRFLKDYYESAKAENKKFSLRYFSRLAGFKSQSVLAQVIEGKRNIASYSIDKFVKALKLAKEEGEFFRNLVLLNQSEGSDERVRYAENLIRSRKYREIFPLKESEFHYFTYWYLIFVRELVGLKAFKEDPHWIARQTRFELTSRQAAQALKDLLSLGLIERDQEGRLRQTNMLVGTSDEVTSAAIAKLHKDLLAKAAASIDLIPKQEREISASTVGVSLETAKKIKEMLQDFRKQIMSVVGREQAPDCVYQINFQLFPLSKTEPER